MASLTSKKLSTIPKVNLLENSSSPNLSDNNFYYQDIVVPIVDKIIEALSSGLLALNMEREWIYPIDEELWTEEWESIGAFFTVDLMVNHELFSADHPGWNIKGYSGWGHTGANIEIEVFTGEDYNLSEQCGDLRPEFLNIVAHEIHHLTQYTAPFQRPNCLPFVENKYRQTYFEYFTSRAEAPAFIIGFRAESCHTGKEIKQVMSEYLLSQLSAGVISPAEKDLILSKWINHSEWSY